MLSAPKSVSTTDSQKPEKLNPEYIRFTQSTISTTLSKPKPGEKQAKHLDALVAAVHNDPRKMLAFPPIPVFTITNPVDGEVVTYSLGNRKLYVAKKAKVPEIPTIQASWQQIYDDTWKLTSDSDGQRYPAFSSDSSGKDVEPPNYTLLGQFRRFLETCHKKVDAKDKSLNECKERAKERFKLRCA